MFFLWEPNSFFHRQVVVSWWNWKKNPLRIIPKDGLLELGNFEAIRKFTLWVFPKLVVQVPQKWMVYMENPITVKWHDFGGKPTIFGNSH